MPNSLAIVSAPFLSLLLALLGACGAVFAAEIELHSGGTVTGAIEEETAEAIRLRVDQGVVTLKTRLIRRLRSGPDAPWRRPGEADARPPAEAAPAASRPSEPSTTAEAAPAVAGAGGGAWRQHVGPFLERHCIDCHGGSKTKAGLDLRDIDRDLVAGHDVELWREVRTMLQLDEMPPPEEPRPAVADSMAVVDWITAGLERRERAGVGTSVVLRRLNRREYAHTIDELIGLPMDIEALLPPEPRPHGFDTVGEGLQVSPLHVEQYLAAADQILDRALVVGEAPQKVHYRIEYLGPDHGYLRHDPREKDLDSFFPSRYQGKRELWNFRGGIRYKELQWAQPPDALHHDFVDLSTGAAVRYQRWRDVVFRGESKPKTHRKKGYVAGDSVIKFRQFNYDPGIYRLRLRLRGFMPDRWHGELPSVQVVSMPERRVLLETTVGAETREFTFTVHRQDIGTYTRRYNQRSWGLDIRFRRSTFAERAIAERLLPVTKDKRGRLRWQEAVKEKRWRDGPRTWKSDYRSDERYEVPVGLHVESLEVEGPYLDQWPPAPHRRILPPADGRSEAGYVREVLEDFMQRAYRRPVAAADLAAMQDLYQTGRKRGRPVEAAIRIPLIAILSSPRFLYLVEPGTGDRALDAYELASRLSYFLWSRPPDAELLSLAGSGRLTDDGVLRAQVQRLLDDERSTAFVHGFADQWLHLHKLEDFSPDPTLFPSWNPGLRRAIVEETHSFIAELITANESVLACIDSDWTMLNQTLADHYGIDGVRGDHFRRVDLRPEHRRGGLLCQASILTATSNGIRTLPVHRGIFVLEEFFADPPPPPPPGAGQLEETVPETAEMSVTERLALHRSNPACASCHEKIDPLGFAMESYDPIGAWRIRERLVDERVTTRAGKKRVQLYAKEGAAVETAASFADGRRYDDMAEFKKLLRGDRARFVEALARKLLTYATGRVIGGDDDALVAACAARCRQDDYRMRTLIEAVVLSDAFRRTGGANAGER